MSQLILNFHGYIIKCLINPQDNQLSIEQFSFNPLMNLFQLEWEDKSIIFDPFKYGKFLSFGKQILLNTKVHLFINFNLSHQQNYCQIVTLELVGSKVTGTALAIDFLKKIKVKNEDSLFVDVDNRLYVLTIETSMLMLRWYYQNIENQIILFENESNINDARFIDYFQFTPNLFLLVLKLKINKKEFLRTILISIDDVNLNISYVNTDQLFGIFSESSLSDIDLTNFTHLTSLSQLLPLVNNDYLSKNIIDSKKFTLKSINLINPSIKIANKDRITAIGKCIMQIASIYDQESMLVYFNNGKIQSKIILNDFLFDTISVFNPFDFNSDDIVDENPNNLLILAIGKSINDTRLFYHFYKVPYICDSLDSFIRIYSESSVESVLIDEFNVEKCCLEVLVIDNFTNSEYEFKTGVVFLSQKELDKNNSGDIMMTDDFHMAVDNNHEEYEAIYKDKSNEVIQKLYQLLQNKIHHGHLLVEQSKIEENNKYLFLCELTYNYAGIIPCQQLNSNALQLNLVNLYSNSSKILKKPSDYVPKISLKLTWVCFINSKMTINFLFERNNNKINSLMILIKDTFSYLNVDYNQYLMNVENPDEIVNYIGESQMEVPLVINLVENLINKNSYSNSNKISNDSGTLITIEFNENNYSKILSKFPKGKFEINLHLYHTYDQNSLVQKLDKPIYISLFEDLNEKPTLRTFMSLMNTCQNSKIYIFKLKNFTERQTYETLLQEKLEFEYVSQGLLPNYTIQVMRKQSIISDFISIIDNSLKIYLICDEQHKLYSFLQLLNRFINKQMDKIELDMNLGGELAFDLLRKIKTELNDKLIFLLNVELNSKNNENMKRFFDNEANTDFILSKLFQ